MVLASFGSSWKTATFASHAREAQHIGLHVGVRPPWFPGLSPGAPRMPQSVSKSDLSGKCGAAACFNRRPLKDTKVTSIPTKVENIMCHCDAISDLTTCFRPKNCPSGEVFFGNFVNTLALHAQA